MITANVNDMGIVLMFDSPADNLTPEGWEALLDELKSHFIPNFYQYGKRLHVDVSPEGKHRAVIYLTRWIYVYRDSDVMDNWKYYTSEGRGGKLGDDVVWTLVSWPDLKPKDSFRLVGVVGMVSAFHEAEAKLLGRWKIVHNLDDLIGVVPARGLRSKLRLWSAKAVKLLGSL